MIDLIHSVINTPRTREKRRTRKIGAKIERKLKKPNEFSGFFIALPTFRMWKAKKVPSEREQDGRDG
jgi:hypothetical protein